MESQVCRRQSTEKGQIDATGHLQKWVEVRNRGESPEPTSQAGAATPAKHQKRIKNSAIANEIEHCIDMLALCNSGTEIGTFNFNPLGT